MQLRILLFSLIVALIGIPRAGAAEGRFEAGDGEFLLNGRPFVIKAAELHYPRIPRPYWDHRIKMCKALGMNTICLYVFWNAHESEPDNFNFEGQNDLAAFIDLCRENDMKVILRPGPYVCAEWEMGGLPWWLLNKEDIRLRESDPYFLERVDKFQRAVAREVKGRFIAEGGPIIMVQVENEYGSYGTDKEYVTTIRDMLRSNYGGDVTMFQCDWSSNFLNNGLDDLIWTLNFGTGADIDAQFEPLRRERPHSPLMCSEYWSGWFDKWGGNHETRPADAMIQGLTEMLDKGISWSLYMTHGGTNWGHWAGANSPGYAPDVTSYDYDAPISEQGRATEKYHALRAALARYSADELPPVPDPIPVMKIEPFELTEAAPLFSNLPQPVESRDVMSMERLGQGFGSLLYRTWLPGSWSGTSLTVNDPHDYAQIFMDGRLIGVLDRRLGEKTLPLPPHKEDAVLDILVEATGRINFGRAIKDFKGITESVTLTAADGDSLRERNLTGWEIFKLPDTEEFYNSLTYTPVAELKADSTERFPRGAYRGKFTLDRTADTYLDMSSWGKGLVYVNGHPLGRFWEIGPQQTLYLPGCWLKEGENVVEVFDIAGPKAPQTRGLDTPVLDRLNASRSLTHRAEGETLKLNGLTPEAEGEFSPGNGWQEILFDSIASGRFVAIEFTDSYSGDNEACVAEIYLLDSEGKRLSREGWSIRFADSEDVSKVNRAADKIFDLQESTFWSTGRKSPYPHSVVIDLGDTEVVSGLQYLPRAEASAPGMPRGYRIYLSENDFNY